MKTSDEGLGLIEAREGVRLKAYTDTKGIWTIGVGHTAAAGEPHPREGMTITEAEARAILARDLGAVEAAINAAVKVPLTQHQFDALASLVFNIGVGGFRKSSVLRKLNAKDYAGASAAILMWNKPSEIMSRRRGERAQFDGRPVARV